MIVAKRQPYLALGALFSGFLGMFPFPATAAQPREQVLEQLPRNSALAVLIETRAARWGELTQFELFRLAQANLDPMSALGALPYLPDSPDYDFTDWIGSPAVVALLPRPRPAPVVMADHMIMVVATTDRELRDAYLDALAIALNASPQRSTYRGVPLLYWPPEEPFPPAADSSLSPPLISSTEVSIPEINLPIPLPDRQPGIALALLPDFLVAADNPTALQRYLDQRPLGKSSLADNPQFQRTFNRGQQQAALVTLYGDLRQLLNYASSLGELPELPLPLPAPTRQDLQSLNWAGAGGTLEALVYQQPEGMRFQGRFYADSAFPLTPTLDTGNNDRLLEQLPAATFTLVSGRNLARAWEQTTLFLETASPESREWLNSMRGFFTLATSLDLDRDVFGWMDGEFAFFAFPSELSSLTSFMPNLHLAVGSMLQTSDRITAENTLQTLEDLAVDLQIPLAERTVNGAPVTSLELELFSQSPLSVLSYGWLGEDILTLTSGIGPMQRLINPTPFDPLHQHSTFVQATADFPVPNDGYFYINAGASLLLAYSVLGIQDNVEIPNEMTDYLNTVHGFSLTTATTTEFFQIDALLGLARQRQ